LAILRRCYGICLGSSSRTRIRSLAKGRVRWKPAESSVDPARYRARITSKTTDGAKITAVLGEPLEKARGGRKKTVSLSIPGRQPHIRQGLQDRRITDVKALLRPENSDEMTRMGGRFIGLKININLQKPD